MFTDGRSRKVIFLAHCLLNQNAISDGTAVYPAAFCELIELLLSGQIGIVQLPCPELCCLGLDRGDEHGAERPVTVENTRIRAQMLQAEEQAKLNLLVGNVLHQIREYKKHGFEILGIVGANRSPNCGVDTTSADNVEVVGRGVFMDALYSKLSAEGICIPMIGLKGSDDISEKLGKLFAETRH